MQKLPGEGHGMSVFEELQEEVRVLPVRNNPGVGDPAMA